MAKCKLCKTNIQDGMEYCKDCQDNGKAKVNESYLDSLLNSVKNTIPAADNIYKKKSSLNTLSKLPENDELSNEYINEEKNIKNEYRSSASDMKSDDNFDDIYKIDISDLEDFDKNDLDHDLSELDHDILISDEELYGQDISNLFSLEKEKVASYTSLEKELKEGKQANRNETYQEISPNDDTDQFEETETHNVRTDQEEEADQLNAASIELEFDRTDSDAVKSADLKDSNLKPEEISELSENDSLDLDLDELLNSLDTTDLHLNEMEEQNDVFQDNRKNEINEGLKETNSKNNNRDEAIAEIETEEAEDEDFLNLLKQMSYEDPVTEDVIAINELLKDTSNSKAKKMNSPSDVGEVFSDALKVVSSLKDDEYDEDEILKRVSDQKEKKASLNKKAVKKAKKKKGKKEKTGEKEEADISLWKRLFGNVKNDKTAAEHAEELKAKSLTEKSPKKVKGKGKSKKVTAEVPEEEEALTSKKTAKDKSEEKKAAKKEKKEKKKKTAEVIQVIDEIDEDPGRINRLGAVIIFIFFGVLATVLILGTKVVSYTLSIEHATTYFGNRKYTQAYNEVYGVDIKDEDIEIYDKIMTVMYVNKQLNSYNSYYAMEMYPEALDSLLKGLSRYNKYIELATILGIESDLDYVRSQLLAELNNVYDLSEKEAIKIINSVSMEEYSLAVYDVVMEKMNN